MNGLSESGLGNSSVLVVGCGGIGGVLTAHLAELGADVTAVSRNPAVVAAVRDRGFRLRGEGGSRTIQGRVRAEIPDRAFDFVMLTTQPTDVEAAARQAAPHLSDGGRMVCLQNGLCEERVAGIVGDRARVVGGVVAWGATMVEPGVFDRTSAGGFVLGRLDGSDDLFLRSLATMLETVGPVTMTDNLAGARWSKLAINCAVTAMGALSGERLGTLIVQRPMRRLALEIMTEVVTVARRLGVSLEKIAGTIDLEWLALTDAERAHPLGSLSLTAKHATMLAAGMRYRRLRSSMLAAIERGHEPPIDYINGEVVSRAAKLELSVPFNEAICDQIRRIGTGELRPSRELVEALARRAG